MQLDAIVAPGALVAGLAPAVQALPVAAHVLAGSALAAGLVLWFMGRRVVKPMFAIVGAILGAGTGFLLAPLVGLEDIGGLPTPYIGLTLGLVVGLALGVALFRFAIAVSMGAVVGLAGVLISLVVMTPAEARTDARGAVESAAEASLADPAPTAGEDGEAADEPAPLPGSAEEAAARLALSEETRARARAAAERVQAFLAALGEALRPRWEALPARSRLTIVAAGLGGVVAGFLVGLVMPVRSSAAVTALFGAAVWLPAAVWLAHAGDAPGRQWLNQGPLVWTMVWAVVALVGFAAQVSGLGRGKRAEAE